MLYAKGSFLKAKSISLPVQSLLNVFFDTVKLVPETFKTLVVWDFSKALFATGSLVYSIVKNN